MPEQSKICALCGVESSKFCSVCKKAYYCSTEHQKSHRKAHKHECFPAILAQDEIQGRYFVATRNIRPGERIFSEKALVVGPTGAEKYFHKICLGCYRVVKNDYKCSTCGWPVCNEVCENLPPHCEAECKIFATSKVEPYFTKAYEYDFIKFLRTLLLREKDDKKWEQVQQLASHIEIRRQSQQAVLATVASFEFISEICCLKEYDYDTVDHVVGVWGVNSFGANAPSGPHPTGRLASFLFPKTSLCSHNCVANTRGILTEEDELVKLKPIRNNSTITGRKPVYAMELLASRSISEGQAILITYAEVGEGTFERQKILRENYYFSCECQRCTDPSEFDTYFSGIKCPSCTTGYLLPSDPLDPESDWLCSVDANNNTEVKCESTRRYKYAQLMAPLMRIKYELNNIGQNDTETEIKLLEKLILDHSGQTLHKNHWLLMEVEYRLIQRLICFMPEAKNVNAVVRKCIAYSQHCLAIADIIRPGFNVHRGKILYCLCQARLQEIVRSGGEDVIEKRAILQKLKVYAQEAQEILAKEPERTDEKTIADALTDDIKQIQRIISVLDVKIKNSV